MFKESQLVFMDLVLVDNALEGMNIIISWHLA